MQLWRDASNTSEEIAPILHHYCFHCFTSFFIYTFFRWKQKHVKSHGVSIKLNDYIPDIEIKFAKKDGIFQRFLDTWALLGASLAFSPIIPIKDADEISFIKNDDYLLQNKDYITLNELLKFKPREFENKIIETFKDKWIKCQFITGSPITQINNNLKNYLILFTASNIARYRPYMWDLILDGKNVEYNQFASAYITALYDLSINNLLRNVYDLFSSIENKYFSINN